MQLVIVLIKQLVVMFLYMGIGYIMFKKKIISKEGSKELGAMILYIIFPCTIFNAYNLELTEGKFGGFVISFIFAFLALFLSAVVSGIVFGKKHRIENFGACYSNAGYMGIPLIRAVLGNEAVFYAASFVAIMNIYQWTYGVYVMTGKLDDIKPRKILTNPTIIAFFLGIIVFLLQIKIPDIITLTVTSVANMNGPIAMMVLGIYLAQIDIKTMFRYKPAYLCSLFRLFIIPVLTVFMLLLVPERFEACRMPLSIIASAPVAAATAIFAQQNNLSYTDGVKSVCLSTLASIVSMPLIVMLSSVVFG